MKSRLLAKILIILTSVICCVLGFIVLVGSIVARTSIFMDYAKVSNGLFWLALIIGISMFLAAAAGIYGVIKGNICLIGLYVTMVGILSSVFIALTVGIFFVHHQYHTVFSEINCANPNKKVTELMNQYRKAENTLCKKPCPCNYKNYNSSNFSSNFAYSATGAIKMQQCTSFEHGDSYLTSYFLGEVE